MDGVSVSDPGSPRRTVPWWQDPRRRLQDAALERLWELMALDREILDAHPRTEAEQSYLELCDPLLVYRTSGLREEWVAAGSVEEPRRVVSGALRDLLTQWLPLVVGYGITERQRRALGDLTRDSSIDDAVRLLDEEGFHPLHEAHDSGDIQIVMLHPAGLLAHVLALAGQGLCHVRVYFNAEEIDEELFGLGVPHEGGRIRDVDGRVTTMANGSVSSEPGHDGSLRVRLAALQAFARPVAPWQEPAVTEILGRDQPRGREGTPGDEIGIAMSWAATEELIAALPPYAHQLLGPILAR